VIGGDRDGKGSRDGEKPRKTPRVARARTDGTKLLSHHGEVLILVFLVVGD